jgi:hypothetical protein
MRGHEAAPVLMPKAVIKTPVALPPPDYDDNHVPDPSARETFGFSMFGDEE